MSRYTLSGSPKHCLVFNMAHPYCEKPEAVGLDAGLGLNLRLFSILSVTCSSKVTEEQHVQADRDTDRLPPRGDHHAIPGPPQHHPALWCGAHTSPQDGKMFSFYVLTLRSYMDLFKLRCFRGCNTQSHIFLSSR